MPIYLDDRDRLRFLSIFGTTVERYAWRCHSYCLMPNHYHVVIETTEPNLARGMQYLNWRYALAFNNRRGFVGHLFDARYHSVIVESDLHLLELARYVVLNPVRSRLCRHPLEWRWSSYAAAIGESPAPEFLTLDWLMGLAVNDHGDIANLVAEFWHTLPPSLREMLGDESDVRSLVV